jgi:hypothetical protein
MNYLITALVLIAYELQFFYQLKKLLGYKAYEPKKPFDCFFCLSTWANTITTTILIINNPSLCYLYQWGFIILTTKIIDLLWNQH